MIEMRYHVPTSGVQISFVMLDGVESLYCGPEGFEDLKSSKDDEGVATARCQQTSANLRHLSFMLAAMAVRQEREEHTTRCQCGCEIYRFGGGWVHRHDKAHACEYDHDANPRPKTFFEV